MKLCCGSTVVALFRDTSASIGLFVCALGRNKIKDAHLPCRRRRDRRIAQRLARMPRAKMKSRLPCLPDVPVTHRPIAIVVFRIVPAIAGRHGPGSAFFTKLVRCDRHNASRKTRRLLLPLGNNRRQGGHHSSPHVFAPMACRREGQKLLSRASLTFRRGNRCPFAWLSVAAAFGRGRAAAPSAGAEISILICNERFIDSRDLPCDLFLP